MGMQNLQKMPFKKKIHGIFFFSQKRGNIIKLETTYKGVHKVKKKKKKLLITNMICRKTYHIGYPIVSNLIKTWSYNSYTLDELEFQEVATQAQIILLQPCSLVLYPRSNGPNYNMKTHLHSHFLLPI